MGCLSRNKLEEILEGELDPTEPVKTLGPQLTNQILVEDIGPEMGKVEVEDKTTINYLPGSQHVYSEDILVNI